MRPDGTEIFLERVVTARIGGRRGSRGESGTIETLARKGSAPLLSRHRKQEKAMTAPRLKRGKVKATVPWLVLSTLTCFSRSARPGEKLVIDDKYAQQASHLLREVTKKLRLRRTSLKEVSPQYCVGGPVKLKWKDALAYANKHFGTDKVKRALFLRKYYTHGQPALDLDELKLEPTGVESMTGSARGAGYIVVEAPGRGETRGLRAGRPAVEIALHTTHGEWVVDPATGERTLEESKATIVGLLGLVIHNVNVAGTVFDSLEFDVRDELIGFSLTRRFPDQNVTFWIGGNTTGVENTDFYWVRVEDLQGEEIEDRRYDEKLRLERRRLSQRGPDGTYYAERYIRGIPFERVYYKDVPGRGSVIDRRVRFPLPKRRSVDKQAIERAFDQLGSKDFRQRKDARETFILMGSHAVSAIKARFDKAAKQRLDFIDILEVIPSPAAIDFLISLFDHKTSAYRNGPVMRFARSESPLWLQWSGPWNRQMRPRTGRGGV